MSKSKDVTEGAKPCEAQDARRAQVISYQLSGWVEIISIIIVVNRKFLKCR